ncbi:MAG: hypothetical protein GYB65_10485, partial [Chloroflexi bacterium]|nr:hypothetical protein [Chloroflexota bacterium]
MRQNGMAVVLALALLTAPLIVNPTTQTAAQDDPPALTLFEPVRGTINDGNLADEWT